MLAFWPFLFAIRLLLALACAERLQQPHVDVLDFARPRPNKFSHARQNVFERFDLQSELGEFRGLTIGLESQSECGRIPLSRFDSLLLVGRCLLLHCSGST